MKNIDYYPFGMGMPGRQYSAGNQYRYGFNGKENDNEVKGNGNEEDFGLRIYDTRVGRFLSLDPLRNSYVMLSPYQSSANSPIAGVDLNGGEFKVYHLDETKDRGKTKLIVGEFRGITDIQLKLTCEIVGNFSIIGEIRVPVTLAEYTMGDLGIRQNVVSYDNKLVVLPDGIDWNNLPALDDPVWETFETTDEYVERLNANINQLIQDITDLSQLITLGYKRINENSAPGQSLGTRKVNLDEPSERSKRLRQLERGRPKLGKKFIKQVWENAKEKGNGIVKDPDTGVEIKWDGRTKGRGRIWHMGHVQNKEYRKLVRQYKNGEINWKEFKEEYYNPNNYHPELPHSNLRKNQRD